MRHRLLRGLPALAIGLMLGCDELGLPALELPGDVGRAEMPIDSAAGEIAFSGNAAMIVPVHLNGQGPLQFALDTGSTLTCVDRRVADRLRLPERQGMQGVTAGAAGLGQMRVVRIDSLRVGGVSMRELDACVVELRHARQVGVEIEGLIGLNFLRAYRVGIDFDRQILSLQNPSTD
jgi:predicted aspartyl protease